MVPRGHALMNSFGGLRVAHATSGHPPDDDRIFFKEARSLVRAGASVTLIYPRKKSPPTDTHGVEFLPFEAAEGPLRRAVTIGRLRDALESKPFDLIHCHEPESLWAALKVKKGRRTKVIFDSHELWSAVAGDRFPVPVGRGVARLFRLFERRQIARCDAAIGVSRAITQYLASVLGEARTATILNAPVAEVFGEPRERAWGEVTTLCHDGFLSFERGLETLAEAVRQVADQHPIAFKIVGDVFDEERDWLESFVAKNGLGEVVQRTGWLPYCEVGGALAPCHIGLVACRENANATVAGPNKIYNYLMYGIPFVGPDFVLTLREMASEEGLCALADVEDPRSYAAAICRLIEDRRGTEAMAARALEASRTRYRWEHMEPKLFSLYEKVLAT